MNTETDFTFDDYIMPTNYANAQVKLDLDSSFSTAYTAPLLTTPDCGFLPTVFDLPDSPPVSTPPLLSSSATISEKIAKVNTLPDSFLPQFFQYSKETYENGHKKKAKRMNSTSGFNNSNSNNSNKTSDEDSTDEDNQGNADDAAAALEIRRQIHIQSEQKRRAQISDGFQELRQHLPGCVNKKMSKAALLHRTVQHLQHLKKNQSSLLTELERLVNENEQLKKFQDSVLQKQALERMYHVSM